MPSTLFLWQHLYMAFEMSRNASNCPILYLFLEKNSGGGPSNPTFNTTLIEIEYLKLGLYDKKKPTNILKIRIFSETSIPYLIRHASVILGAGLHLYRRASTSEHCWKKNSGTQRARISDLWITSLMRSRLS